MPRLFVIGGSDAGISAALRARELALDWEVTIATANLHPNFSICGIPYFLSGEVSEAASLAHRKAADIKALGIKLLLNHTVESIGPSNHQVTTRDSTGYGSTYRYDKLVIGTGAASIEPRISGLDLPGVFQLRWIADAIAFQKHLDEGKPRRIVIIGGGYIGLEMSEALTRRNMDVTVVEMASSVMTTIDPDLGQRVGEELQRNGVHVVTGQAISSILQEGTALRLDGPDGFSLSTDMILVAVGARPETRLAEAAGITLGYKNALKVNRRMETNIPDIYAAGDCVETWHRITGTNMYLPLGTTAHKQGRIAGENAIGGEREFEGSLGTQSVRLFDYVVARTGFHDRDAATAGFAPLSIDSLVWDHKVYYPGAKEMLIRVTADRASQRLLGAQIIGHYGTEVSKRIDIFAAAIHHGMSVAGISDLDLSYTPPLSSPWDPVQIAAQAWSAAAGKP